MNKIDISDKYSNIKKHSLIQSIILHLLPGIMIGIFYFIIVHPITSFGYPSLAALILAAIFILVPFELGVLIYLKRKSKKKSFDEIVLYREPIPTKQYLIWVPVIFVASGILFMLLTPVSDYIEIIFSWIPNSVRIDMGLSESYSKSVLIVTYSLGFIVVSVIAPTVEEIYFRGYLLPRIPNLRGWSSLLHSMLFAFYHTWSPWMIITRTIGVFPLIYVVQKKKNIYLGIIAHCLINSIDFIVGCIFIISLS
ncbi:type II CAAX endopeptidase family protein [Mycoplasmatota bacterium zrk1]